jgi:hypothetical protein
MEAGWSTKELHRMILLSATYQQSSEVDEVCGRADPENQFLSRASRHRLDFEAMRDTLLALASDLDPKLGGLPVDLTSEPFPRRRTVYGLIDRQNLPGVFRTFDFANPDTSSQGRFHTTVPQQALFLMNNPFVVEQARDLAQRPAIRTAPDPKQKIQALYRLVYQREPGAVELDSGRKFLAAPPTPGSKLSRLEEYAQVLLLSNELMFVD